MELASTFLARLAPSSAAAWHVLGTHVFAGEVRLVTENRIYLFRDGVFARRWAVKSADGEPHARLTQEQEQEHDDADPMTSMRLVGFLAAEGALWSLSASFRPGAHAVMWRPSDAPDAALPSSFLLTSAVTSITLPERPAPPSQRRASISGIRARVMQRPPRIQRPAPPSMTRLYPSLPTGGAVPH